MPRTPEEEAEFQELRERYHLDENGKPYTPKKQTLLDSLTSSIVPEGKTFGGVAKEFAWGQPKSSQEIMSEMIPLQALFGAGDAASNMIGQGMQNISKPIANQFGMEGYNHEPIKSGQGPVYETSKFATEMAPYLYPAGMAGRLATSTGVGALTHEEGLLPGAVSGLAFGLAGEAAMPVARGAGKLVGEGLGLFTGQPTADRAVKAMKHDFETGKEGAFGIVKPYFDEFGENLITKMNPKSRNAEWPQSMKRINETFTHDKNLLTKGTKDIHKIFKNEPSVNNAHKLIKQLAADERALTKLDPLRNEKESLYKKMITDLEETMFEAAGESASAFREANKAYTKQYAEGPAAYYSNPTVEGAAAGNKTKPEALRKEIQEGQKREINTGFRDIGPEHKMSELERTLSQALGRRDLLTGWVPSFLKPSGMGEGMNYLAEKGALAGSPELEALYRALIQQQGQNK